jgi:transposase
MVSVVPRPRPPYSDDFRREAVELVRSGRSIRSVAESLDLSQQTLRNWLKQTQLDLHERDDGLTSDEREELRRLRREVRQLEQSATSSSAPCDRALRFRPEHAAGWLLLSRCERARRGPMTRRPPGTSSEHSPARGRSAARSCIRRKQR